jgi:primosomal protein N' (replication factor Y)
MTSRRRDFVSNESPESRQGPPAAAGGGEVVSVLLPLPLGEAYDYGVPQDLAVSPGDFVVVPLGKRETIGVVWGPGGGEVDSAKLRDIAGVMPAPPMRETTRRFVEWVASYTVSPPGSVLRMAMSAPSALEAPRTETLYRLASSRPDAPKLTPARRRVLDLLRDGPAMPLADLAREAGVGTSVIKGLVASGALETVERPRIGQRAKPDWRMTGPALSDAQRAAADDLAAKVRARKFGVTLVDGVPGAGKTEVYFEAVAAALAEGRQALVMLPEIALSTQWLERFARRFGARPAEWHSDMTSAERRQTWRDIAERRVDVVVGARSALFLPFVDLGVIVVDEEHDQAFKQEDGVIYNARDMAVVRARLESVPIALASATPSLESVVNAQAARYDMLHLPERHGPMEVPRIEIVDIRRTPPARNRWLAPPVVQAIRDTLDRGEQALLFLNRRGYAPLTLCRTCGHRLRCPHCSAWLVEHRFRRKLVCHHCGHGAPLPEKCPACEAEESFVACGPGVERLAEEVMALFPDKRLEIFASDTVPTRREAQALVERIANNEVDLVIGTQMAAKGYHFPHLTLVAVVDADLGLSGGDLRAAERTFQLLYQAAGRAGRAEHPGRVLLQTAQPHHPVMQALASGDRERFLETEANERRHAGWPPFGRLAALIVSGTDEQSVDAVAARLGRLAPSGEGLHVLGPAPAPLSLLRGRFRRRLLLRADRSVNVQSVILEWLAVADVPGTVRVQVDIDPYSFM